MRGSNGRSHALRDRAIYLRWHPPDCRRSPRKLASLRLGTFRRDRLRPRRGQIGCPVTTRAPHRLPSGDFRHRSTISGGCRRTAGSSVDYRHDVRTDTQNSRVVPLRRPRACAAQWPGRAGPRFAGGSAAFAVQQRYSSSPRFLCRIDPAQRRDTKRAGNHLVLGLSIVFTALLLVPSRCLRRFD